MKASNNTESAEEQNMTKDNFYIHYKPVQSKSINEPCHYLNSPIDLTYRCFVAEQNFWKPDLLADI